MKHVWAASRWLALPALALGLAACSDAGGPTKAQAPIPAKTLALMSSKGMSPADPILVRVYKKEAELEVWKRVNGQYALLKTLPICRWSGQLGPKKREGDRQAPEGFYAVTPAQMNPNSSFYLSFDTGFPNAHDRANSYTGSFLMVHGTCSSRGCYAMTDEGISELYSVAREAFAGGQRSFQFQAYPFRMNAENLARYRDDPNMAFWQNLKQGSDQFEITRREPKVSVCGKRYAFNTVGGDECKDDPTLAPAVAGKDADDRRQVAELVAKGTPATRLVYADGGQHESFRGAGEGGSSLAMFGGEARPNLGTVSRPEALAEGPREVAVEKANAAVKKGTATAAKPEPSAKPELSKPGPGGTPGRTRVASADEESGVAAPGPARKRGGKPDADGKGRTTSSHRP